MLTVFLTFDSAVAFFAKFHNCIGLGFIHGSLKMVSSDKQFDNPAATKRMADLVNHLSIEEQRILARLLNDWEKRDQRLHPRSRTRTPLKISAWAAHLSKVKTVFPSTSRSTSASFSLILKFQSDLIARLSGPLQLDSA
jgi:type VI protein secretion system component VasF